MASMKLSSKLLHFGRPFRQLVLQSNSQCFGGTLSKYSISYQCLSRSMHMDAHFSNKINFAPERMIGVSKAEQKKLLRQAPEQPLHPRVLRVAIIGAPNAGKSTLANKLMGWRFSSVSGKVHTTRRRTLGVLTEDDTQVIFLDTPGMITRAKSKKHNLEMSLLTDPHSCLHEADLIMVVQDVSTVWGASKLEPEVLKVLHLYRDKHAVLILNKVDLVTPKQKLLKTTRILTEGIVGGNVSTSTSSAHAQKLQIDKLFARMETDSNFADSDSDLRKEEYVPGAEDVDRVPRLPSRKNIDTQDWIEYERHLNRAALTARDKKGYPGFNQVFMVAAVDGDGVFEVKNYLLDAAEPGLWQYHSALITDQNPLELARQCVWEKVMDHIPAEIPYQIRVEVVMWEVDESGMLSTAFNIVCQRTRQLTNTLGKEGSNIKKIATEAKQDLMNTFRREVMIKIGVTMKSSEDIIT